MREIAKELRSHFSQNFSCLRVSLRTGRLFHAEIATLHDYLAIRYPAIRSMLSGSSDGISTRSTQSNTSTR